MIEYLFGYYYEDTDYLEDIYGDEIKSGEEYYVFFDDFSGKYLPIKEINLLTFAKDELDLRKEER